MKKDMFVIIFVVAFGIAISELMILYGDVLYGSGVHIINLLVIMSLILSDKLDIKIKYILQSLILPILLRVISISMPQLFANVILQYSLVYGIMFLPIYSVIKSQSMSAEELGVNFKKMYIYIPLAIPIGIIIGIVEYNIIGSISLIENIRFSDIAFISMVMFIFVGTVEEVIFRSILQTRFQKVFGIKYGILASGIIFGVMNVGYGTIDEMIFAGILGIVIGYLFYKSNSIHFVILIRGVSNTVLFGFLPLYGLRIHVGGII